MSSSAALAVVRDFRSKLTSQYLEVKSAHASKKGPVLHVHRPVRHIFILETNTLFKTYLMYYIFPDRLSYASAMLGVQPCYHPGYSRYGLGSIFGTMLHL